MKMKRESKNRVETTRNGAVEAVVHHVLGVQTFFILRTKTGSDVPKKYLPLSSRRSQTDGSRPQATASFIIIGERERERGRGRGKERGR